MLRSILKRIGVLLLLVEGESTFARRYYRTIGLILHVPFIVIGCFTFWGLLFPDPKDPRDLFTLSLLSVLAFAFLGGPFVSIAMIFGLHVPLESIYDTRFPPVIEDVSSKERVVVRCGAQKFGILWNYLFALPTLLCGLGLLVPLILSYAGWMSVSPYQHRGLPGGILLTIVGGLWFFWRNTVIFDRRKEEVKVFAGFLFFEKNRQKVKWKECKAIHISRIIEYRVTSAGKVENIVSQDRSVASLRKYFYSPLILETQSGDIEIKQFVSWWLATRLARKISNYTGIPIGSVAPRPDHRVGENL